MKTNLRVFVVVVTAIALMAASELTPKAAVNSVSGHANGASVNVTATVLGVGANVSVPTVAPVTLPPQGGSQTNQVASVNVQLGIPGVLTVLSTGLVVNTTSGTISSSAAHAESSSTVNNLNILNGLVTASTVRAKSTSDGNGASATSTDTGSFLNQLRISGVLQEQSEFAPNTTIAINASVTAIIAGLPVNVPVSGTLVLNEQFPGGNGVTTSSLTVNYIHLNVSGSVAGQISLNADVIVASATSGVDFTAGPANNCPTVSVSGGTTRSVQVGQTLTFSVSANDPDGNTVTLQATNLPTNSSFNPNPATGTPTATGTFSFTPVAGQANQTFNVNFTASDNNGCSGGVPVPVTVQITVTQGPPPNQCPTVTVIGGTTRSVQVGQTLTFQVSATDPDGNTVTLQATNLPANSSFTPNPATGTPTATGTFSFTPAAGQGNQTFNVNFTATDNNGCGAGVATPVTVQITVTLGPPPNQCPTITVTGGTTRSIAVGLTLTFQVSATDPDGNTVTLQATNLPANSSFTPNPVTGTPTASGIFSFTPGASQANQSFNVIFTATDNNGCSGATATPVTVNIAVIPLGGGNNCPTITVSGGLNHSAQVGQAMAFGVSATDPDGDLVTLTATNLPSGATFTPNPATGAPTASGTLSFTPSLAQANQSFNITLTATDNRGCSSGAGLGTIAIAAIAVGPPVPQTNPCGNHAPIISVPPLPLVAISQSLEFLVKAADQDGDQVTVSAKCLPPNASFDAASGRFSFSPGADQLRAAQLGQGIVALFGARDDHGAESTAIVDITPVVSMASPGDPIVSIPPGPIMLKMVDRLSFAVAGLSQIAGCPVSMTASGMPDLGAASLIADMFTFTPTAAQIGESFIVSFTATDCFGHTRTSSVNIVVIDADSNCVARGAGSIDVVAKRLDFSTSSVNDRSGAATVSIANKGGGSLTINSILLSDDRNYRMEGFVASPVVLQPGGVIELRVLFEPKNKGQNSASLTINSSDPNNPTVEIKLKGKGN